MTPQEHGSSVERHAVLRTSLVVGIATGAYGVSFGAISVASGLTVAQTCALSLLMFSGGSQFAMAAVLGGGGAPLAASATATLLGSRNVFYGLRMSTTLGVRGLRRLLAAQLVMDEAVAVSVGQATLRRARLGFWATGIAVFAFWNLATLLGAAGAGVLRDPRDLGLDAAAPAAFLALLAPRIRAVQPWLVGLVAAGVAVASVPLVPVGVPVLIAGAVALTGLFSRPRPLRVTA